MGFLRCANLCVTRPWFSPHPKDLALSPPLWRGWRVQEGFESCVPYLDPSAIPFHDVISQHGCYFSALDAVVTSATAGVKICVIFFRIPLFTELVHQFFRRPTAYATLSNSLATCQHLQFSVHAWLLMHVTAYWGCTNTIRVLTRSQLWERQLSWLIIGSGSQLMQVQLPSAERDFFLSSTSRVNLECAVFSWVQTMVWLPALAILNACLDVNARDCMLGLDVHNKSLNS